MNVRVRSKFCTATKNHGGNFEVRPMELADEISTLITRGVTKFSSVCVVQEVLQKI